MVFPVAMYGCESWTIKKAECWRIDAFELWCWRRLLRVPWTAKSKTSQPKGNQPWIFIGSINTEGEALGHLIQRADSLEKTLMLVKTEDWRKRGWQRTEWLDGITNSMSVGFNKLWEMVKDRKSWCGAFHWPQTVRHDSATKQEILIRL